MRSTKENVELIQDCNASRPSTTFPQFICIQCLAKRPLLPGRKLLLRVARRASRNSPKSQKPPQRSLPNQRSRRPTKRVQIRKRNQRVLAQPSERLQRNPTELRSRLPKRLNPLPRPNRPPQRNRPLSPPLKRLRNLSPRHQLPNLRQNLCPRPPNLLLALVLRSPHRGRDRRSQHPRSMVRLHLAVLM